MKAVGKSKLEQIWRHFREYEIKDVEIHMTWNMM